MFKWMFILSQTLVSILSLRNYQQHPVVKNSVRLAVLTFKGASHWQLESVVPEVERIDILL